MGPGYEAGWEWGLGMRLDGNEAWVMGSGNEAWVMGLGYEARWRMRAACISVRLHKFMCLSCPDFQEQINQAEAAAAAALSDEEQPPKRRKRSVSPSSQSSGANKIGRAIPLSNSDSCVAKIKKKAQRIRKRKYQKERERLQSENANPGVRDLARDRMASGGTSVSENDPPLNGRTRLASSSSIYETAEDFSTDEKSVHSPLSDSSPCHHHHHRLTSSASENAVPSASSVEDLTVRPPVVSRGRNHRGNKRGRSSSSNYGGGEEEEEDEREEETGNRGTAKKGKRGALMAAPESESGVKRTKTINGLVNGAGTEQFEIKPLVLVWAKCRGYPPYPALVRSWLEHAV